MINDGVLSTVRGILIEEAQSDVVGLWALVWEARHAMPTITEADLTDTVLAAIDGALSGGAVVAGDLIEEADGLSAFTAWTELKATPRIRDEWQRLGRDPNLGEVVWFVAPSLLPVSLGPPSKFKNG